MNHAGMLQTSSGMRMTGLDAPHMRLVDLSAVPAWVTVKRPVGTGQILWEF